MKISRLCHHHEIGRAVEIYIRSKIYYLQGECIFREEVIVKVTEVIRDQILGSLANDL